MRNLLLKNLLKTAKEWGIYSPKEICSLAAGKGHNCPSGRPAGRLATVHISNRCASGRPGHSLRSTAQSTGPHPRVGCFQSVDRPVDRPKWLAMCTFSCTSVDRAGRPTSDPVDRQSLAEVNFRI